MLSEEEICKSLNTREIPNLHAQFTSADPAYTHHYSIILHVRHDFKFREPAIALRDKLQHITKINFVSEVFSANGSGVCSRVFARLSKHVMSPQAAHKGILLNHIAIAAVIRHAINTDINLTTADSKRLEGFLEDNCRSENMGATTRSLEIDDPAHQPDYKKFRTEWFLRNKPGVDLQR